MNEVILKVQGMHCTGCENRIKNALENIENIETVEANSKDNIVTISYKNDLSINEIKTIIEDLGFEVEK